MITQTNNRGSTRNSTQNPVPHRRGAPQHISGASSRAKKRRCRMILFYIFSFLLIIAAAAALSLTVLFKIDTIEVSGSTRYSLQEIINASGIQKGNNLFLVKTSQAGAAIKKKLPYIGSVSVSRKLPAKILITVDNAVISGAVQNNTGYVLVSTEGKVLEQVKILPANCPVIIGLELASTQPGSSVVYKSVSTKTLFEDLMAALQKNKVDKITKIDISNTYRILVEYDKRITMNFGLASSMDYKIRMAKLVLAKLKNNEKGVLNLSVAEEADRAYFSPDDSSLSRTPSSAAASSMVTSSVSGTSSAKSVSSKASSSANISRRSVSSGISSAKNSSSGTRR